MCRYLWKGNCEKVQAGLNPSEPVRCLETLSEPWTGLRVRFLTIGELWTGPWSGSQKFRSELRFGTGQRHRYSSYLYAISAPTGCTRIEAWVMRYLDPACAESQRLGLSYEITTEIESDDTSENSMTRRMGGTRKCDGRRSGAGVRCQDKWWLGLKPNLDYIFLVGASWLALGTSAA